jgi:predicted deacylase
MSRLVKIGELDAGPGTKRFGTTKVAETSTYNVKIPIMVVNGRAEGPTLCLTGGTRPVEYPGIEAVIRLANRLNPEKLRGTVIGVPIMNMPGLARVPE